MGAVDWLKSESEVGKTSYATVPQKQTELETACERVNSRKFEVGYNVAKVVGSTYSSEGFLVKSPERNSLLHRPSGRSASSLAHYCIHLLMHMKAMNEWAYCTTLKMTNQTYEV